MINRKTAKTLGLTIPQSQQLQAEFMARGHFIVRRLERTYGEEVVKRAYEAAG